MPPEHGPGCLCFLCSPTSRHSHQGAQSTSHNLPHHMCCGRLVRSADIPMLVAGDFNSIPGSPAHSLLVKGKVDPAQVVSHEAPLQACMLLWRAAQAASLSPQPAVHTLDIASLPWLV